MNFTVDWEKGAENDLMDLWLAAPDQRAITTASAAIDQLLSTDPYAFGQHLSEGLWRLRVPPLVVHYSIDPNQQHVEVTAVARTN
jgi:mRNA-degrading endonuclease RelE of RelBE toxin-antitoxin system